MSVDFLALLTIRNLLAWLCVWSLFGFVLMFEDKDQAVMQREMRHSERISERTFHEVALVGGFPGMILAAKVFHHKTLKKTFWGPVAVAIFLWGILLVAILHHTVSTLSSVIPGSSVFIARVISLGQPLLGGNEGQDVPFALSVGRNDCVVYALCSGDSRSCRKKHGNRHFGCHQLVVGDILRVRLRRSLHASLRRCLHHQHMVVRVPNVSDAPSDAPHLNASTPQSSLEVRTQS
jgi:uncharacterized membrane protein YsdA (DUF1294 family)